VAADQAQTWNRNIVSPGIRGVEVWLPEKGTDDDRRRGVFRRVVERTIVWLHQFRRLRARDQRRADIHQAFFSLGCILICFRTLDPLFCQRFEGWCARVPRSRAVIGAGVHGDEGWPPPVGAAHFHPCPSTT
jgi:hypothetical protein